MKRMLLLSCLLLTLCNAALGVAECCRCVDNNKTCCGYTCTVSAQGVCTCSGKCANEN